MNNVLFKNKYRIKSTRLKNWDYSHNGVYSVTICTKDRKSYFGNIENGKMELSTIGKFVQGCWQDISKHCPSVVLDEFIVMPNHIHGIIMIEDHDGGRDAINRVSTGGVTNKYNPMLNPYSLSTIIRWYKGRTSFEINKIHKNKYFQWQSRFHDHIVRNKESLNKIREYIHNNPLKWEFDRNNPECKGSQEENPNTIKNL